MRCFTAILAVAVTLALAGPAAGAQPTKATEVFDLPNVPFVYTTCGGVDLLATRVHIERAFLTFFDQDGSPIRRHRHVFIEQTLVNPLTGQSLTYVQHANAVEDFLEHTFRQQGMFRLVRTADGMLVAAGQVMWDDDIDPVVPLVVHGANTIREFNAAICDAVT